MTPATPPPITPRRMNFPFDADEIPAYWFGGNALATHRVNAVNLLFPDGERFFIRSVRHYLDQITDPTLRHRVRGFFAQEALHGSEHDHANVHLRANGLEFDSWLQFLQRTAFGWMERWASPSLRLSVTAALEHLTASMSFNTLTTHPFQHADPVMRDLLEWHSAEEIEHKSVAFDVLQSVNSSWLLRAVGMVLSLVGFLFFWQSAASHLMKQDPTLTPERIQADRAQLREWGVTDARRDVIRYALRYFRPGFHPDEQDDYALAAAALERLAARYPGHPALDGVRATG